MIGTNNTTIEAVDAAKNLSTFKPPVDRDESTENSTPVNEVNLQVAAPGTAVIGTNNTIIEAFDTAKNLSTLEPPVEGDEFTENGTLVDEVVLQVSVHPIL